MTASTTADYLAQHGEALEAAIGAAVQKAIASRAADPVAYVARELSRPAKPVRALLIIDVQNDFISGTLSLKSCPAGADGARVVPVSNRLRAALPQPLEPELILQRRRPTAQLLQFFFKR